MASVPFEEIPIEEKLERAHDLCVAAVLGDTIYNFGELLMHPIFQVLEGLPASASVSALLRAMNAGNFEAFEQIIRSLSGHPLLGGPSRQGFIREKMCLMTLAQVLFSHLKQSRRVSFARIAAATKTDQVELLLMKAFSLGLICGKIDEPAGEVVVEWVPPRVLDREQLAQLATSIGLWKERVEETLRLVANLTSMQDLAMSQ